MPVPSSGKRRGGEAHGGYEGAREGTSEVGRWESSAWMYRGGLGDLGRRLPGSLTLHRPLQVRTSRNTDFNNNTSSGTCESPPAVCCIGIEVYYLS